MAYSSFALFPTLPAIYNLMPSQKHKRRTATSIMAGYFDPRPVFTNDLTKTTLQPVRPSSLSSVNISDPAPELPRHETRPTLKKSAPHASRKSRKFNAISVIQGTVSRSKGKRVKDVHPDDKENAVSNREPPRSSSPRLTSSPPASPLPSVTIPKEKPKASGFWRARSSNTSASPAPSSLKRKLSTTSQGSALPSQIGPSNTKKSRLSTSLDPEAPSRLFASSDSLSFRSSSLDFDTQNLVSEDKPKIRIKQRSVNDDTKLADEATTQPSEGVPIKEPGSHSDPSQPEGGTAAPSEASEPKLSRRHAPQLYEVIKKAGIRCKLCGKISINVSFMEMHLRTRHSDKIDMNALPPPPPRKPRGPRKNVAIKKGWKGWVEEDLEPQKLILLDKPEVLPERTTRSGRKI